MLTIAALLLCALPALSQRVEEIFGLRLGMSPDEVRAKFAAGSVPLTTVDSDTLSAPSLPAPVDAIKTARLGFEKNRLHKNVVIFEVPPYEASADTLLQFFEREKFRLTQQFGQPSQDFADMKAPSPNERYDWLKRGRAFYRTSWKVGNRMAVILWLYGEDAGIVLMETYQGLE